ncbi:soluble quino protein glucose dehydrogenase, partial [Aureobasidium melanogenum]
MVFSSYFAIASLLAIASAQSSCGPSPSGKVRPSVASGYKWQVVATNLARPRGIAFDDQERLLVVESGSGSLSAHTLSEDGSGCVTVNSSTSVVTGLSLNHGIAFDNKNRMLYASNTNETYGWQYDSSAISVSNQQTLSAPGMLVISFGSLSNLDLSATNVDSGTASVKAFNLTNRTSTYTYQTDGLLLGWGLRNEVGLAEHPGTGGIWGVENSADQITRHGVDVHATNPGEELNFLGYVNGTESKQEGSNFGYPWCFSAWNPSILPDNGQIQVGTQFAIDASSDLDNQNKTDAYCANQTQSRLVFNSHMAPLDIKFNDTGRQAWITFHGSWNSPNPVGYKLSVVNFTDSGEPVDALTSKTAAVDIFGNANNSVCPNDCFRPVAMALDSRGRIFLSSDATGEIYLVTRDESAAGTPTTSASSSTSSPSSATSSKTSAGVGMSSEYSSSVLILSWLSILAFIYM